MRHDALKNELRSGGGSKREGVAGELGSVFLFAGIIFRYGGRRRMSGASLDDQCRRVVGRSESFRYLKGGGAPRPRQKLHGPSRAFRQLKLAVRALLGPQQVHFATIVVIHVTPDVRSEFERQTINGGNANGEWMCCFCEVYICMNICVCVCVFYRLVGGNFSRLRLVTGRAHGPAHLVNKNSENFGAAVDGAHFPSVLNFIATNINPRSLLRKHK